MSTSRFNLPVAKLATFALAFFAVFSQQSARAASITWGNSATDYNSNGSWLGGAAPVAADNATFNGAATTQPSLSASSTNQGLTFTLTGIGYTLSSGAGSLTLTNVGTAATSAINALNTSGTNTISAPIILGGAAASTATFTQAAGGTMNLSGNISSTNTINGISLATTSGIFTLSGSNSYAGNTSIANATMTLNLNNASALSTGALVLGSSVTINNTSGAGITLANNNINLSGGSLTFSGSNALSFGSGTATLSGANRTVTANGLGVLSIGSIDADTTGRVFSKLGTGTLLVSGAAGSTFQGGTVLNGGILQVANNTALGTGGITFTSGTLQAVNSAVTLGNSSTLTALTVSGTQNLTLSGDFTNSGGNRILTSSIATGGNLTLSGTTYLQDPTSGSGRTLTIAGTGNTLISGAIVNGGTAGASGLTHTNTGLTILTGSNSYTGPTTITSGTIQIGNHGTVGSLAGASSILGPGMVAFDRTDAITISNLLGSNLAVTQQGGSSLTLSNAANVFTGGLFVTSGTVIAGNANVGVLGRGHVNLANNTEVDLNGNSPSIGYLSSSGDGTGALVTSRIAGSVVLSLGSSQPPGTESRTYAGLITNGSGTVGITKINTGTQTLTGANSYTGVTRIESGVLAVTSIGDGGVNSALGASGTAASNILLVGGTLRYTGTGHSTNRGFTVFNSSGGTIDSSGSGAINFTNTGAIANGQGNEKTLILTGTNTGNNVLAGSWSDFNTSINANSLTKSGAGKWVLTAANTYAGQTRINAGTLLINGTHVDGATTSATTVTGFANAATGHFQVAGGAILGGTGRISGNDKGAANSNLVLIQSGGVLAPGASIGTLTLDGSSISGAGSEVLNMASGADFEFELAGNGGTPDQLNFWNYVAGDLLLNTNDINLSLLGTQAPGNYNVNIINFFSNSGGTPTTHTFLGGLTPVFGGDISAASIDWDGVNNLSQSIAINYTVVPEPSTFVMMGLGLGLVLYGFRRRKA